MIEAKLMMWCMDCGDEVLDTEGTLDECVIVARAEGFENEPRCDECRARYQEKMNDEERACTRGAWGNPE